MKLAHTTVVGGRLEATNHGGADGDDSPPARTGFRDRLADRARHIEQFAVHHVGVDIFTTYRLEGAGADMQRDMGRAHALCRQPLQDAVVEVQSRGRRRDRAGFAGIDRLVAFAVGTLVGAANVRRQRHVPVTLEQFQPVALPLLEHEKIAVAGAHHALDFTFQPERRARPRCLAGAQVGEQPLRIEHPFDHHFDPAAAVFLAVQAGRDHPRIVEHQQVSGIDEIDEIGEPAIGVLAVARIDQQQARGDALAQRLLCNQFLRQVVIEIAELHAGNGPKSAYDSAICRTRHCGFRARAAQATTPL